MYNSFNFVGPIIFRIPKKHFANYAIKKGIHDNVVQNYGEVTYGCIEADNDLIYLRFFGKHAGKKTDQKIFLEIKYDQGEVDVIDLEYSKKLDDPLNIT